MGKISARYRLAVYSLMLLLQGSTLEALDTLVVGSGELSWTQIKQSSRFVALEADSVWIWDVERNANLTSGILERGGTAGLELQTESPFGLMITLSKLPGVLAGLDEDATTAFAPDEYEEVSRQETVYIDLGATFGVDRIRFFPRLDKQHSAHFLGAFELGTSAGAAGNIFAQKYRRLLGFSNIFPNRDAVVDKYFDRREVRYIRLQAEETQPWEIAELEIYGDGTVPTGEFISQPLFVRGGYPIWGRVVAAGREGAEPPLTIQTRTGSDPEPEHYFIRIGDELEQVSKEKYEEAAVPQFEFGTIEVEQGPILPNPEWSSWQTVVDGLVLSPSPRRYLQFRIFLSEPGTVLKRLLFEYVSRPLLEDLGAEISPLVAEAGEETSFTLSMEVHVDQARGDTGFRYIQVLTPAAIQGVDHVLVDDQEALYTATYQAGEGFTINLWRRMLQDGSFVQLVFRGTVFRDATPFQVRALDRRTEEGQVEEVYQIAREEDVDPISLGGSLVVRLAAGEHALIKALDPRVRVFTPNGDGINDVFEVSYTLLKLTRPAAVFFEVFDLQGRRLRRGFAGADASGRFVRVWDGRDDQGARVAPGVYLYRVRVEGDAGTASRQGVLSVVY